MITGRDKSLPVLKVASVISYTLLISQILVVGCNKKNLATQIVLPEEHIPQSTFIDEPILLDLSDPIEPYTVKGDTFYLSFQNINLVKNGTYNDFDVEYVTSSSCDEEVFVYNYWTKSWDQLSYAPSGNVGCISLFWYQHHLFSARGLKNFWAYLSNQSQMKLTGKITDLKVRALEINPDYLAIPIRVKDLSTAEGLTYDGNHFWVSSNWSDKIYELDSLGYVLREIPAPYRYPFGMAFDGQHIWIADGSDRIFKIDSYGPILCEFTVPTDYPGGLAWGNEGLWLCEYEGANLRTFRINPLQSCSTNTATIEFTSKTPGGGSWGLAWADSNLLVVSDSLYEYFLDGTIFNAWPLPVRLVKDISWDGEAVWMINRGPRDVWSEDLVITRFRLP